VVKKKPPKKQAKEEEKKQEGTNPCFKKQVPTLGN